MQTNEERRAYYAAHPEKERAYSRAYYAAHPEKKRAYSATYRAAHREELRTRNATYHAAHRKECRARSTAYYTTHQEEARARSTTYYTTHQEEQRARGAAYRKTDAGRKSCCERGRRRHALKRQQTEIAPDRVLTRQQWEKIVNASQGKCYWCRRKMEKITQDHVIPLSKGGAHTAENVVAACMPCNRKKGTKVVTLF